MKHADRRGFLLKRIFFRQKEAENPLFSHIINRKYILVRNLYVIYVSVVGCSAVLEEGMSDMKRKNHLLTSEFETVTTSEMSAIVMLSPATQFWPSRKIFRYPRASLIFSNFSGSGAWPAKKTGSWRKKGTCIAYEFILETGVIFRPRCILV